MADSVWIAVGGRLPDGPTPEQQEETRRQDEEQRRRQLAAMEADNKAKRAARNAENTEKAKPGKTVREQVERLGNHAAHAIEVDEGKIKRGEMKPNAQPTDPITYDFQGNLKELLTTHESKEVERWLRDLEKTQRPRFDRLLQNKEFRALAARYKIVGNGGLGGAITDLHRAEKNLAEDTTKHDCTIDTRPGVDPRPQRIQNAKLSGWCTASFDVPAIRVPGFEIRGYGFEGITFFDGRTYGSLKLAEGKSPLPNVPGLPPLPGDPRVDDRYNLTSVDLGRARLDNKGTVEVGNARFNLVNGAVSGSGLAVGALEDARQAAKDAVGPDSTPIDKIIEKSLEPK